MRTTRAWLKSFSGKSAMTRRGRKLLRVAVLRVFGFGLPPAREEKHPADAVPIYKEMIAPILKQANNARLRRSC